MKLLYVSVIATPVQIKLARSLGKYAHALVAFYDRPIRRPQFWQNYPLNESCHLLGDTIEILPGKYFSKSLISLAKEFDPDALIIGGFFNPSNYLLYKWAKQNNKKVIFFSETFWIKSREERNAFWQTRWVARLLPFLYRSVDLILAVGDIGYECFVDRCEFPKSKVKKSNYPVDLEDQLKHPLRSTSDRLVFLFPHRLIGLYNPLLCVRWFKAINEVFPLTRLRMNAFGELREQVELEIKKLSLQNCVEFLDEIREWDRMHEVYRGCDVMLSTKSVAYDSGDWSIADVECAASGLGIIVTDCSRGLAGLIEETGSGFVIDDYGDFYDVIKAATQYIEVEGLLRKHGQINREKVESYSIDETAKQYIAEIEAIGFAD